MKLFDKLKKPKEEYKIKTKNIINNAIRVGDETIKKDITDILGSDFEIEQGIIIEYLKKTNIFAIKENFNYISLVYELMTEMKEEQKKLKKDN